MPTTSAYCERYSVELETFRVRNFKFCQEDGIEFNRAQRKDVISILGDNGILVVKVHRVHVT